LPCFQKLLGGLLVCLAWISPAYAVTLKPMAHAQARAGHTWSDPGEKSWMGLGDVQLLPLFEEGSLRLLTGVSAFMRGQQRSVLEDSTFVQQSGVAAEPMLQISLGGMQALRLMGQAKHAWNKEALNEDWGRGLYDYEQYGGGAEFESQPYGIILVFGAALTHQSYPNWHELGSFATENKHYYTKDFQAWQLRLASRFKALGLSWDGLISLLNRGYTDCYLVKEDGTLDLAKRRSDFEPNMELALGQNLSQEARWSVASQITLGSSNQGFFTTGSSTPYYARFYDYTLAGIGPTFTWTPQGEQGIQCSLAYALQSLSYPGRPVRDAQGQYTTDTESGFLHTLAFDCQAPVLSWASVVLGLSFQRNASNQKFSQSANPSYSLFNANAGLDLRY
jgi:hypothetical protein